MKFAAHLGLLDEVELLDGSVDHLLEIGVDRVVIHDLGSTDGSLERAHARCTADPGRVRVVESGELLAGGLEGWSGRALALMREEAADWAIFLDVDERLLPLTGRIADCRDLAGNDVLVVDRFNVPLTGHGAALGAGILPAAADTWLLTARVADLRGTLEARPEFAWSRGVPIPKVLLRPARVAGVTVGGHDALPQPGIELRRASPADLVIAHLPFTTRSRFERKVRNARRTLAENPGFFTGQLAWHWRRWVGQLDRGELDAEFDRQRIDTRTLGELRAVGALSSAAEWFRARAGSTE